MNRHQIQNAFHPEEIRRHLLQFDQYCCFVRDHDHLCLKIYEHLTDPFSREMRDSHCTLPPIQISQFGDPAFRMRYGSNIPYYSGSMANGIANERLVMAMGNQGYLASFGAAGLLPSRIEKAIQTIQTALPNGPYLFNLIHSPNENLLEEKTVDLYIQYQIPIVEASAYMDINPHIVRYKLAGLSLDSKENIVFQHRIIAKVSRSEIAEKFMKPAPSKIVEYLLHKNLITSQQAELARFIPVADDITVEADSGGHTDNRPLQCLLPSILSLRDEIQNQYAYPNPIMVGAAGGIGTPEAAYGAFMMGAAYIVTGSINQSCVEAAVSEHTKKLLSEASMTDVMMAPAADMFEMGVKLQVLKRGTLFPMRAQKLYELYQQFHSIDEIPRTELEKIENQIFQQSLEKVWESTQTYFMNRDPHQLDRAVNNPKRKMALLFRWYLGLSSKWSNVGDEHRKMDYQIWCGPAMGAFNQWVKGSYLEKPENRSIIDMTYHLLKGMLYHHRIQTAKMCGIQLPHSLLRYIPEKENLNSYASVNQR